jgi:tetratricopeptide (TPR) repeat protein
MAVQQFIQTYKRPFLAFCAGAAVILVVIYACSIIKSGFVACAHYKLSGDARSAYECGNYYFGMYGPHGYDIHLAEYYYTVATEKDPTLPDVWHQYARIAFLQGEYDTALARINRQFEHHGDEVVESYYIRGLIYGYADDHAKAEGDFKRYLQFDPNNWAANNDLAWIYFEQGKYAEAAALLEPVLKGMRDDQPWLLSTHAMAIYNLGMIDGARSELDRAKAAAAKLTPEDWMVAYPGNDPRAAARGLAEFQAVIDRNLALVHSAGASSTAP